MQLKTLLLPAFIAAHCALVQAAPVRQIVPKGATNFSFKPHRFAVWLPGKPVRDQMQGRLKSGYKFTAFTFVADSRAVQYVIVAISKKGAPPPTKNELDDGEMNFLRSSGSNSLKRQDFQQGGFKGREMWTESLMTGRLARVRLINTPQFSYSLVAHAEKKPFKKQSAQITRVFDSFRILPQ